MADFVESKSGSSSPHPPFKDHGGPIIEESQKSEEYQQDLQVVLGTAFGVVAVVGLAALAFLLYKIYRARHSTLSYAQTDDHDVFEPGFALDVSEKSQPMVLILYAYDCPLHEQVVSALANFIMETCGVTVSLDLLEENDILDRGIDDWLVDRLQEADYILVLCSLGARLRCTKKRVKFKSDSRRVLPDYFTTAVDYVAEKMRVEKQKGLSLNKFITAYMDYCTRSDIPPQLETAVQYCLMKDIHKLHTHLNCHGLHADKSETASQSSGCDSRYHETETGALLKATIELTKAFFIDNPCWMDDQIDQTASLAGTSHVTKAHKFKHNILKQPLLPIYGTPLVSQPSYIVSYLSQERLVQPNGCYTLPLTSEIYHVPGNEHSGGSSVGIFQGRQNSLPSSLASSHIAVSVTQQVLSKSMNSFALDQSADHDGLPCFYCNNTHMDNRPECRHLKAQNISQKANDVSLHNSPCNVIVSRSPTTILQAEVHQEWGLSNIVTPEKRSENLVGELRSWTSDNNTCMDLEPMQSLPSYQHCPSISAMSELDRNARSLKGTPATDSSTVKVKDRQSHRFSRSLSDVSLSTLDSGSVSDGDSLERDLYSIQNISSFHDFINSSSFTNGRFTGRDTIHMLEPLEAFSCQRKNVNSSTVV